MISNRSHCGRQDSADRESRDLVMKLGVDYLFILRAVSASVISSTVTAVIRKHLIYRVRNQWGTQKLCFVLEILNIWADNTKCFYQPMS